MKIRVSYLIHKNSSGKKEMEVEKIDEKEIHEILYKELSDEEWHDTFTKEDLEITKIVNTLNEVRIRLDVSNKWRVSGID